MDPRLAAIRQELDAGDADRALHRLRDLPPALRAVAEAVDAEARALYELGRLDEAEAAIRRLIALRDSPAARRILGVVLQMQGADDAAESAFRDAVRLDPHDREAHVALSDLVWMRTGDVDQAAAALDAVLRAAPSPALVAVLGRLLVRAGAAPQAHALLLRALARAADPELHMAASKAATAAGDKMRAVEHAEAARRMAPGAAPAAELLAETLIAAGRPDAAQPLVEDLLDREPHDQAALALQAVIWRLAADHRYGQLYDYEAMVRSYAIDTPPGYRDVSDFLAALAGTLDGLHRTRSRTLGQSHRGGSKTWSNLALSPDPVLQALFQAVDAPVRAYIDEIGAGEDPLRARRAGDHRIAAAWSVRLSPGGRHLSHVHPEGWLSSAFYVETPPAAGREGFIHFGESPLATEPPLGPEHYVESAPGRLVLFPSYMLHGTEPFAAGPRRTTVSFDVLPRP